MDSLFNALGMAGGNKRVYQISQQQVTEAEFQAAKVFYDVVFEKDGLVDMLGPAWSMVNDPRFIAVEECFVFERDPVFGGDANLGRVIVTDKGVMGAGATASLEEYAMILGEGRECLRALKSEEWAAIHPGFPTRENAPEDFHTNPQHTKDWEDRAIWAFLKMHCPNWFTRADQPNREAITLFRLLRADLLGLVQDYSRTALAEDWIRIDTQGVVNPEGWKEEVPIAHVEVYNLDAALRFRSELRVTAYKVLVNTPGMRELLNYEMTEAEKDELLKIVFRTPYQQHYKLPGIVRNWIVSNFKPPMDLREAFQTDTAKRKADILFEKLAKGEIEVVRTEIGDNAQLSAEMTEDEKAVLRLLEDPIRLAAFEMITGLDAKGIDAEPYQHLLTDEVVTEEMLAPLARAFAATANPVTVIEEPSDAV